LESNAIQYIKLIKDKYFMTDKFVPEIVAFCCHYCAYSAADLAGSMRLEYPPSIKVIELPCSGKLDITYALRAFEDGADGVLVAG
jgi:F420-non-reducing hydrogenase iron-sulfur subunit